MHYWIDEEAAANIRTAIQAGQIDEAKRLSGIRTHAEAALTGPLGADEVKPRPTPATSKRPAPPSWWKGPQPVS